LQAGVFVQHPGITRGLALGELGLGIWLAENQKPVAATSSMNYEERRRSDRLTADSAGELAAPQAI
jgi:hypothetical protein